MATLFWFLWPAHMKSSAKCTGTSHSGAFLKQLLVLIQLYSLSTGIGHTPFKSTPPQVSLHWGTHLIGQKHEPRRRVWKIMDILSAGSATKWRWYALYDPIYGLQAAFAPSMLTHGLSLWLLILRPTNSELSPSVECKDTALPIPGALLNHGIKPGA